MGWLLDVLRSGDPTRFDHCCGAECDERCRLEAARDRALWTRPTPLPMR